jgi:hypothetical protein
MSISAVSYTCSPICINVLCRCVLALKKVERRTPVRQGVLMSRSKSGWSTALLSSCGGQPHVVVAQHRPQAWRFTFWFTIGFPLLEGGPIGPQARAQV